MIKIVKELKKWREARNMQDDDFVVEEQVAFMLDECKEVLLAKTAEHKAEEYCDIAIFAFNALATLKEEFDFVHTQKKCDVKNIILICANMLATNREHKELFLYINATCEYAVKNLGYDFEKMMLEKIKVISSREQDPEQAQTNTETCSNHSKCKKLHH